MMNFVTSLTDVSATVITIAIFKILNGQRIETF
jgi:hypothetical protein